MKTIENTDKKLIEDFQYSNTVSLPINVFEKDILVTDVLRILTDYSSPFPLIFCGGTCLSKAHKVIERMSEDIDFKVFIDEKTHTKSQIRKQLSEFKKNIVNLFKNTGFVFDETCFRGRNENRFLRFDLPYQSLFKTQTTALRNVIQVEFTATSTFTDHAHKPVNTLINEFLGRHKDDFTVDSVTVALTLAEKTVALLRRMGQRRHDFDPSIIRHLYDSYHILKKYPEIVDTHLQTLFNEKVQHDRLQFAPQCPEFASSPRHLMLKIIEDIGQDPEYEQFYSRFLTDLVYGEHTAFEETSQKFIAFARFAVTSLPPHDHDEPEDVPEEDIEDRGMSPC